MIIHEINNEREIRQRMEEEFDLGGAIIGAEYIGLQRAIQGTELTLRMYNNEGLDDLVYILLIPSTEPGYYDAWSRRSGVSYYSLMYHCKAKDPEEMQQKLFEHLRTPDDE